MKRASGIGDFSKSDAPNKLYQRDETQRDETHLEIPRSADGRHDVRMARDRR